MQWLVDVAIGEEDDGTRAGDAVDVHDDVGFDRTVRTMDAMARSLEISAGGSAAHGGCRGALRARGHAVRCVGRALASMPSTASGCSTATCSRVRGARAGRGRGAERLDAPAGPDTVGSVGRDVWSITHAAGSRTITHLPVPYVGSDSRAVTVPPDVALLTGVTLRSADCDVIAPAVTGRRPPSHVRPARERFCGDSGLASG